MKRIIAVFVALCILGASSVYAISLSPQSTKAMLSPIASLPFRTVQQDNYLYPTIESIFQEDHTWTATLSAEKKVVLIATGDVIPARSVNNKAYTTNSFTWAFEKTSDGVKNADITLINLETPLIKDCPPTTEGMIFCGDQRHIEGLKLAGVDIASFANNHMGNHGSDGVLETKALLENNGIKTFGTRQGATYMKVKGQTYAFLGYSDIGGPEAAISWADKEVIAKEIAEAKTKADIVIVEYHWGVEYRNQPDDRQIELGHFTIDSGADLVIGNHPHWIQPIELYKGKLITYAHGNYIFDQMWSEETKHGVVGRYIFYDGKLVDVEYLPIYIENYGQASFLGGERKSAILEEIKKQSDFLNQNI